MTKYAKLTAGLIGAWFILSLATSALHLYRTSPNAPPLAVGLAVLTPIVVFVVWFAVSPALRQFTLSLNPRILTMVHSWRVIGFVFLVLATYGVLPRAFALPAGWGDIAIGVTAAFVALKLASPNHRTIFIVWQVLGIVDLVMAVSLATLVPVIDPNAISTAAMSVLPLSLIPTFAVPLLLILHGICIMQAALWPSPQRAEIGQQLRSPAA
jgi:hypothetical protein